MEESGGTSAHRSLYPCAVVQEAVKAMLRCFGLETAPDHPDVPPLKPQDPCPPPIAQASDTPLPAITEVDPPPSKSSDPVEADDPPTTGEEGNSPVIFAASELRKPPIRPGSGPQIN